MRAITDAVRTISRRSQIAFGAARAARGSVSQRYGGQETQERVAPGGAHPLRDALEKRCLAAASPTVAAVAQYALEQPQPQHQDGQKLHRAA